MRSLFDLGTTQGTYPCLDALAPLGVSGVTSFIDAPNCGGNCVGLKPKQAALGVYKRKSNGQRSAVNVIECHHNVTGALLGCRFHNPKTPTTNFARRYPATVVRCRAILLVASGKSCEECPVWGAKSSNVANVKTGLS